MKGSSTMTIVAVVAALAATTVTMSGAPTSALEPDPNGPRPLSVVPDRGAVGTEVTVTGAGCAPSGQDVVLVFAGGGGDSTEGAVSHPDGDLHPDAEGRFAVSFEIPAVLSEFYGSGGGAVVPGRYGFQTLPPGCSGSFTVTGPPAARGSMSLHPTSGPAGTQITVSGNGCENGQVITEVVIERYPTEGNQVAQVGPEGRWEVHHFVAPGAPVGEQWQVTARCFHGTTVIFDYEPRTFTVTGTAPSPAAAPVLAQPRYTG